MAKIINEDDVSATYETVAGEQVKVPKNVPWYESLGNALAPPKLIDLGIPVPAPLTSEEIEANNIANAQIASAKPFVPAGPEANAGPGTPSAPVGPIVNTVGSAPPMITQSESSSQTTTTANKTRPEDDVREADAKSKVNALITSQAERAIVENQKAIDESNRQIDENAKWNEEEAIRKDRQQAEIIQRVGDIDRTVSELNSMTVDPNRMFGDLSTGNKIAASISLFLGALGAPASGGPNLAMDVLNKAIDRDIDAQKANISTKTNVVSAKRGAYKDFLDMTGNEDAAKLAEQIRLTDIAKRRLESIAMASKNALVKDQAEAQVADLNLKQAQRQTDLHKIVANSVISKQSQTKQAEAAKPLEMAGNPIIEKIGNYANAIEYMRELRTVGEQNKKSMGPIAGRMTAWANTLGVGSADQAGLGQRILQSVAEKTKAISGAATTDAEFARLRQTMGALEDNPDAFFKKLDNELAKLEREYDNTYKSLEGQVRLPNKIVTTTSDKKAEDEAAGRVRK